MSNLKGNTNLKGSNNKKQVLYSICTSHDVFMTSSDHIGLQFEEKMSKISFVRYFLSQNIKRKGLSQGFTI